MGMCELVMRLSKVHLDEILADRSYFWTLTNEWRDTDRCIDIDKAWHGIHYLFNNSAWGGTSPTKWIIFGDISIPELDGGYGPARYLKPSQVSEVNKLLSNISVDEMRKRYDPNKFDSANIYPDTWLRDKEEAFKYLLRFYKQLKTLYQKAASAGEYVLMVIG